MKLLRFSILFFAFASLIVGCKKKDSTPANYFSFSGKTYEVSNAYMSDEIFPSVSDTARKMHVYQFIFINIAGKDTTELLLAAADTALNTLGGNYPAVDVNSKFVRGIFPDAGLIQSRIILSDNMMYSVGAQGSLDVNQSGSNYTVKINSISAGLYSVTNAGIHYDEIGKINGTYTGGIQLVIIHFSSGRRNGFPNSYID